jgi:hypothetical protein
VKSQRTEKNDGFRVLNACEALAVSGGSGPGGPGSGTGGGGPGGPGSGTGGGTGGGGGGGLWAGPDRGHTGLSLA